MSICAFDQENVTFSSCDDNQLGAITGIYFVPIDYIDEATVASSVDGVYTTLDLSSTAYSWAEIEVYPNQTRSSVAEGQEAEGNGRQPFSVTVSTFLPKIEYQKIAALRKGRNSGRLAAIVQQSTGVGLLMGYDDVIKTDGGLKLNESYNSGEEFSSANGITVTLTGLMAESPNQVAVTIPLIGGGTKVFTV